MTDPGGVGVLDPDSVEWLSGSDGPVRVRFALRLAAAEHVVGFGERFHALDQRGHLLDATVFEQYKRQGHRTYLPMPFAVVVGAETGWGFHVATSRRTWYDVGVSNPDRILVEAALDAVRPGAFGCGSTPASRPASCASSWPRPDRRRYRRRGCSGPG